ncbi:hypothetical protein WMY93_003364 [Mugilogobius chulae]|uniref:Uncharacterized protein n=1 Tax=Mugilogobius chulae TaxID=88201 RepID=A0AAW0PW02_9GOBI
MCLEQTLLYSRCVQWDSGADTVDGPISQSLRRPGSGARTGITVGLGLGARPGSEPGSEPEQDVSHKTTAQVSSFPRSGRHLERNHTHTRWEHWHRLETADEDVESG